MNRNERMRELATAVMNGSARPAEVRALARWVLDEPEARQQVITSIRVVPDGEVYRIIDQHGRRYALSAVDESGCFEAENCMTQVGWEHLTAFPRREAERLAAVLRRWQWEIERVDRVAAERDMALAVADELARGLSAFGDACDGARKWVELTAGAKWAIAELDDLRQNAEYRALHLVGIGALIADLQEGTPIRLAMCRPPAQHPERMAILQAALAADAQAAVNRGVVAAVVDERLKSMWASIRELDSRTFGLRRTGGVR